jgi:hypothetical protein
MTTYKLDKYIAEAQVDPFILEISDSEKITIQAPTAETLVEVTEVPVNQTREIFYLLCGEEQFDDVWEHVKYLPAGVLQSLIVDLLRHFNITPEVRNIPGGSRASRRLSKNTVQR